MRFWKMGGLNQRGNQRKRWDAPRNKGIWAFPYPFWDHFAIPEYYWIRDLPERPKPIRERTHFEYTGPLYTKLGRKGEWTGAWELVSTEEYARRLRQLVAREKLSPRNKYPERFSRISFTYIQVFIAKKV